MNKNILAEELVNFNFSSFLENDIFYVLKRHDNSYEMTSFSVEDIPKDSENNYLFSDINVQNYLSNQVKLSSTNSIEEAFSFLDFVFPNSNNELL